MDKGFTKDYNYIQADPRLWKKAALKSFLNYIVSRCIDQGVIFVDTNRYIANRFHIGTRQVTRWVSKLKELGYLWVDEKAVYDRRIKSWGKVRNIVVVNETLSAIIQSERAARGKPHIVMPAALPYPMSSFFVRGMTFTSHKTRFNSNNIINAIQNLEEANFYLRDKSYRKISKDFEVCNDVLYKLRQIEFNYTDAAG
ncbi:MAG: hypothetical protein LBO78_02035 [Rickettsiales bacterium]|jgi:hypothetical protein|nr:hypothetical protein [Rickettsiales bacterium]